MAPSLLLVEDQAPIRFAVHRFFSARGWRVDACASAPEALDRLGLHPYRAVIADLRLDSSGGMAGYEVVAAAARLPVAPCIVVVSAYGTAEVEVRARELGADLVLEKPVRLQELLARVEAHTGTAPLAPEPRPAE